MNPCRPMGFKEVLISFLFFFKAVSFLFCLLALHGKQRSDNSGSDGAVGGLARLCGEESCRQCRAVAAVRGCAVHTALLLP